MIDWIDEHISATVQHLILSAVLYAIVMWPLGNAAGAAFAFAWNTSRELRDAQKGSGFGWKTLLIPDVAIIVTYLILARISP